MVLKRTSGDGLQERPINRLKAMYELRAYVDSMYKAGGKAKDEGRPVAWCMLSIPTPILTAMGIEAVFPENYGTICASAGAAAGFLDRAESEGFPTHMCGYCRNGLGYAARMAELGGQIPPEAPGEGLPKPTLIVGLERYVIQGTSFSKLWGATWTCLFISSNRLPADKENP